MTSSTKNTDPTAEMLEAILLPICSLLLKRGLSAGPLIDAAKMAYLQAAIKELTPPGKKVNVSRISVASGFTRKETAALLRRQEEPQKDVAPKKSQQQRALRVLHGWAVDHSFHRDDGRPADLPLEGDRKSFPLLVKKYGGDVTPVSVLRELERMEAVTVTSSGKVKYRRKTLASGDYMVEEMAEFGRLLKDFANTVQQVSEPRDPTLFFGFKDSTVSSPQQAALFQRVFAKRAATLLESMDQWLAHQAKAENEKPDASKATTRVGLGVYLVQDDEA